METGPGQYAGPSQYAGPGQFAGPGQYAGPSQYAGQGQYAGPSQYAGQGQYPGPSQYAGPGQYAGPSQYGNFRNAKYEIDETGQTEPTATNAYPTMQPPSPGPWPQPQPWPQQPQTPQQGYVVFVKPVEAYQQDYYKTGPSSNSAEIKPLVKR